jgi:hypothetical protein
VKIVGRNLSVVDIVKRLEILCHTVIDIRYIITVFNILIFQDFNITTKAIQAHCINL